MSSRLKRYLFSNEMYFTTFLDMTTQPDPMPWPRSLAPLFICCLKLLVAFVSGHSVLEVSKSGFRQSIVFGSEANL